ncbi:thioredoxin [Candidatus Dependentiae bacterium]|nr:thioredoxin [Candidatus Dependentiae bacterium]
MAIVITSENFEKEIKNSDKPVILDVYATWCGPCQYMTPVFEELSKEMGEKYKFAKLNIDEERDIAVQYNVSSVPTFIFIKNNEVVGREMGFMEKDTLKKKIEEILG